MLSYLHGFHAGNHADVLKHSILSLLLSRLTAKDRPITYMDSHSGSGYYDLNGARSVKTGEAESGILRLLERQDAPHVLVPYISLCKRIYYENSHYPGSPAVAAAMTRPGDTLILMELHPAECDLLKVALARDSRVHVHYRDGFSGLVALSPPANRRGIVLIDPSYETDEDWVNVATTVSSITRRWPESVIAVWYPLVRRRAVETESLKRAVGACGKRGVYCAEFCPAGVGDGEWGLYGSGMMIVNPPWKTDEDIAICLPWIADALAVDSSVSYHFDWLSTV